MNKDKVIHYWLTSAKDDIRVARHLYNAGDYPQAMFFGHLYLEKILKALVVQETGTHAPYSHKLLHLADLAGLELDEEQKELLLRVTAYNIESRYPEELLEIKHKFNKTYCQNELKQIKELVKCFKKKIKS